MPPRCVGGHRTRSHLADLPGVEQQAPVLQAVLVLLQVVPQAAVGQVLHHQPQPAPPCAPAPVTAAPGAPRAPLLPPPEQSCPALTPAVADAAVLDDEVVLQRVQDLDLPLEVLQLLGRVLLQLLHGHQLARAVAQRVVAAQLHAPEVALAGQGVRNTGVPRSTPHLVPGAWPPPGQEGTDGCRGHQPSFPPATSSISRPAKRGHPKPRCAHPRRSALTLPSSEMYLRCRSSKSVGSCPTATCSYPQKLSRSVTSAGDGSESSS